MSRMYTHILYDLAKVKLVIVIRLLIFLANYWRIREVKYKRVQYFLVCKRQYSFILGIWSENFPNNVLLKGEEISYSVRNHFVPAENNKSFNSVLLLGEIYWNFMALSLWFHFVSNKKKPKSFFLISWDNNSGVIRIITIYTGTTKLSRQGINLCVFRSRRRKLSSFVDVK